NPTSRSRYLARSSAGSPVLSRPNTSTVRALAGVSQNGRSASAEKNHGSPSPGSAAPKPAQSPQGRGATRRQESSPARRTGPAAGQGGAGGGEAGRLDQVQRRAGGGAGAPGFPRVPGDLGGAQHHVRALAAGERDTAHARDDRTSRYSQARRCRDRDARGAP